MGIAPDGDHFFLKGDNNEGLDYYENSPLIPAHLIEERLVAIVYTRQLGKPHD